MRSGVMTRDVKTPQEQERRKEVAEEHTRVRAQSHDLRTSAAQQALANPLRDLLPSSCGVARAFLLAEEDGKGTQLREQAEGEIKGKRVSGECGGVAAGPAARTCPANVPRHLPWLRGGGKK